jgi:hypothetical protein
MIKKIYHKIRCLFGFYTIINWSEIFEKHGNYLDADLEMLQEYDECEYCKKKIKR